MAQPSGFRSMNRTRRMIDPGTNCHKHRHDDDHGEQQPGNLKRRLSDTWHSPSILILFVTAER